MTAKTTSLKQVDTRQDGALLLELYSRDGVGCMISADFYEGIRPAAPGDLDAIAQLLKPLEDKGVLVHRSPEQLRAELPCFTVFAQNGEVLACALVKPLGEGGDGVEVCELGAFCVHAAFRGAGRGDSMLDYLGTARWFCVVTTQCTTQSKTRGHGASSAWCC